MKKQLKIILNITPQTHVRVNSGDKIFFRIPKDQLRPEGLKRRLRLERYNEYKLCLSAECKRKQFRLPPQGATICFFIPVPQKAWSKKKKKQHHGKLHQSKPDLSNLLKAFEDAICSEDKYIAHYGGLSKRWVDFPNGWIEITITEPTEELIMPPSQGE